MCDKLIEPVRLFCLGLWLDLSKVQILVAIWSLHCSVALNQSLFTPPQFPNSRPEANVSKMCWKSPALLREWILISRWLPQPLIWKTLGAEVEYKYLFHPEGPWHIWRAVDMKSWHLCWVGYLSCSQEGTARQSYRPTLNWGHALLEPWLVSLCTVALQP